MRVHQDERVKKNDYYINTIRTFAREIPNHCSLYSYGKLSTACILSILSVERSFLRMELFTIIILIIIIIIIFTVHVYKIRVPENPM